MSKSAYIRIDYDVGLGLNTSWLIALADGTWAAVDPGLAEPFEEVINPRGLQVSAILLTHKHADHIEGAPRLAQQTGARIYGPAEVPLEVERLHSGDTLRLGGNLMQVLDVSGHTAGHVAFYFPELGLAAVGDALFAMGAGRLFEGTAADMWASLERLAALPDATWVLCGHDYGPGNARFALSLDGETPAVQKRAHAILEAAERGEVLLPYPLAEDKATNPFLLYDAPRLAQATSLAQGASRVEIAGALRKAKDAF